MINFYIITILVIIVIFYFVNKNTLNIERFSFDKIPLWTFYDNIDNSKHYLDLCLETIYKYNNDDYDIIVLNNNSYRKYIPEFKNEYNMNEKNKLNYIKIKLLYEYGGIWVDVNSIILKNFKIYTDKLILYDFVGFGCKNPYCDNLNYYSKPTLKIFASRKNSKLLDHTLTNIEKYFLKTVKKIPTDFILEQLWKSLNILINNEYSYFHFDPIYLGLTDIDNNYITINKLISNKEINYEDETKIHIIQFTDNLTEINKYSFFNYNINQILSSNYNISTFFRKSLYPEHPNANLPVVFNENINIYVLYIPKREVYIKETINKIFLNPVYFKGYYKYDLNEEELIKNNFITEKWTKQSNFNFGRVACHMGHINILKEFLNSNKRYALIFEDDIYIDYSILDKIRNKFTEIFDNIPQDANIIYFSFCWEHCTKTQEYNKYFNKSFRPYCRHCYLVSRVGARIIVTESTPMDKPGDNIVGNLIKNKKLISYNVKPDFLSIEQNRQILKSNLKNDRIYNVCI